jgi:molecular chaperone DnaK (HSP70)
VDQQQTASIVVVAKRADMYHGVILGHFPMNGIKPDKVGVPKVEVTLKLTNEKTLLAQALYKQGNKMKVLTFQSNKKPLRSVAQASDVPEDY